MRYNHVVKQGETTQQALRRLKNAKAKAIRASQSTVKLDKKIAFLECISDVIIASYQPSESKYTNFNNVSKKPYQGGRFSGK